MDRYAIFLDAGYFFAAGAQEIAGNKIPRRNIRLANAQQTINQLCTFAQKIASNLGLLRVYWYDAMMGARPSLEQSTLALLNSVKLRFGSLNASGEQKGVDSLIVTDLIELARNRAITGLLRDVENDTLKSLSLSLKANSTIPPEFDRKLIAKTSDAMQRQLTSAEKRKIRGVFVVTLRRHLL